MTLDLQLTSIVRSAMETVLNRSAQGYQQVVIKHLIKMNCEDNHLELVLLVQGTSTGKPTVAQTVAVIGAGITLVSGEGKFMSDMKCLSGVRY